MSSKYDMAAKAREIVLHMTHDGNYAARIAAAEIRKRLGPESERVAAVVEAATAVYIHKQRGVVHPGATGVGMYDDKLSKLERDLERAVLELDMGGESYISRYALPVTGETVYLVPPPPPPETTEDENDAE